MAGGRNFKQNSAKFLSELLSEKRLRQGLEYVQSEDFKAHRENLRREATGRLKNIRERYRTRNRSPEDAARERELSLRLAEVETETAETRVRLAELLEEQEKLREALEDL